MLSNKSNKELVEAGHQFAKALDADMPLTEIAKLVSALSTRLDCAIVRGDELQQKLDAMAAENAAIKTFIKQSCYSYDGDGSDVCDSYVGADESPFFPKTTATETYLNSVRAEGVEMLLSSLPPYYTARADIEHFVKKLRSGTHDTADKA
ncbi:hypothetical protein QMA77_05335 [Pantoea ananatis]|uniref:hypothetical protein n=1 Tax=Pantoea ananas TaxID=553 RepID=UPI0024AD88DD|nr:hypothetical protein [Pantoea ananatis]MDI6536360.1 hypothetical protein [Pantoea ananatis]